LRLIEFNVGFIFFQARRLNLLSRETEAALAERFTIFSNGLSTQDPCLLFRGPQGPWKTATNWSIKSGIAATKTGWEFGELMTDTNGVKHRFALPTGGKKSPEVWERRKPIAQDSLLRRFAEIGTKTTMPFVQAIT
jgi:hypothetical protein